MNIIETGRLAFRNFNEHDAPFIVQLLNSEGWLRYIGDRNIRDEAAAVPYLQGVVMKSYADNGFGLWMVSLKASGENVGMCGLVKRDWLEDVDLGFALLPQFIGEGLGFEAAKGAIDHAFTALNLPRLAAIVMPHNIPSVKLLEKLGFRYKERVNPAGTELLLYHLDRDPVG